VGLLELSDRYYAALLFGLQATFALADRAGGALLEQARRMMDNLHEVNHVLAARGVAPRFRLPAGFPAQPPTGAAGQALADDLADSLRAALDAVAATGASAGRALVTRQRPQAEAFVAEYRDVVTALP
jgi:hypothetical protein